MVCHRLLPVDVDGIAWLSLCTQRTPSLSVLQQYLSDQRACLDWSMSVSVLQLGSFLTPPEATP
jgi:hypothetical protein